MPVKINGQVYYRTAEVCQAVGIGKSTLFRWMKDNIVQEPEHRDRKGWRLFSEEELGSITAETSRIQSNQVTRATATPSMKR